MAKAQPSYAVQWLADIEIPLANKFYRMHGFRGKAKRYEDCAVVRSEWGQVVACGYLRRYQAFKLLAGVAVAPEHQGLGVARQLLTVLVERFDRDTYTFPYIHLAPFYLSLGYERVTADALAEPVGDLYRSYLNQGRDILAMVYRC
ncbi:GNAT family N-acetyltransferase [Microbulbifer sp. OS29]|uniref:GNAT family N-acetyltransferase n=1 Tax=Microbulbifer okhotskensis TaxID=2926617 RepID=A0A9X2EQK8_9GAMM|nr:GNAT family N-acetyltransferase [Microbulbifer okhotskensis]MCO1336577.1 GNAT family N-acetyltransferase [Microbulbifer okhotskensis]